MVALFDMLNNAQNGQALDLLARQYNLSREQAQLAVEALLPAFSQGLKRTTADPYGIGSFMTAMAQGQHAKYFEDATRAFTPQGTAEGNDVLGQLFGSKDLSRAVAAQAAQATGIGQQVLQQMLPAIAAMIMGGLFKQTTGQTTGQTQAAAGFGGADNPLGQIIEEMMKQGGGMLGGGQTQRPTQQQQPADPFDNPFGKVLKDMFGGGAPGQQAPSGRAQDAPSANPWGKTLEEMMGGGQQRRQPTPDPQSAPAENPSGRPRTPYDDIFGEMFETGAKQRDEYQKSVESIFDQFSRGMDRRR